MATLTQIAIPSIAIVLFMAVSLVIAFWTIKSKFAPNRRKKSNSVQDLSAFVAYECGEIPVGEGQARFNFQYYTFAIVFVVFDIILSFLFPFFLVLNNELLSTGFYLGVIFVSIFLIGFLYWAKRDALRWM